jgi:hypothetical protein
MTTKISTFIFIFFKIFHSSCQGGTITLHQRPIRYFHGLSGECPEEEEIPFRICVETGKGLFGSIKDLRNQAKIGCEILEKEIFDEFGNVNPNFLFGFHLEGSSQGGIIARLIFRSCHRIRHLIRRILTYGTPNMGINELADLRGIKRIGNLAMTLLKFFNSHEELKENYSIFQYLNKPEIKDYKEQFAYADVISEILSPISYIQNGKKFVEYKIYAKLEAMINVQFLNDEVIIPISSSTFGMHFNQYYHKKPFSEFPDDEIFHQSGLRELWKLNRLMSCVINNSHIQYQSHEERLEMRSLLFDSVSYQISTGANFNVKMLYRNSFFDRLSLHPLEFLVCSGNHPTNYRPELI